MPFEDQVTVARIRNPDASADLELVLSLECNTSSESIDANIRANAARELPWLSVLPEHDSVVVIVGGGPSATDHIEEIRKLHLGGAFVMSLNGATRWLRAKGVLSSWQCMIDARPDNIELLDLAGTYLLASQVEPSLVDCLVSRGDEDQIALMHLMTAGVEDCLPPERRARGGYALLGGGYGVGNTAICAAYTMGYRTIHCFGFDSSHRDGRSHAYPQPMNEGDILTETVWDGVTYTSAVAMKAHAERFMVIASDLERMGCAIHVHGEGLLPAMWRSRGRAQSEQSKYRLLWSTAAYRAHSPGEELVENFLTVAQPDGLIIDYGCGTGRAGLEMHRRGYPVMLVDFAENCRDPAAVNLPFIEHDLTAQLPVRGKVGFCTDVMEHIPPDDVDRVLANMLDATPRLFLQISTVDDEGGVLIGETLHLTVKPHAWWREKLSAYGRVTHEADAGHASIFYVERA